jgi:hypothetical protein
VEGGPPRHTDAVNLSDWLVVLGYPVEGDEPPVHEFRERRPSAEVVGPG